MRARRPIGALVALVAGVLAGCSMSFAKLGNPAAPKCQSSLHDAFERILIAQEEKPEVAATLATTGARTLADFDLGPRPFKLSSPSGTEYAFLFDAEGDRCLLRLFGRQQGTLQYTDNLTYIATRPLPGCRCEE